MFYVVHKLKTYFHIKFDKWKSWIKIIGENWRNSFLSNFHQFSPFVTIIFIWIYWQILWEMVHIWMRDEAIHYAKQTNVCNCYPDHWDVWCVCMSGICSALSKLMKMQINAHNFGYVALVLRKFNEWSTSNIFTWHSAVQNIIFTFIPLVENYVMWSTNTVCFSNTVRDRDLN